MRPGAALLVLGLSAGCALAPVGVATRVVTTCPAPGEWVRAGRSEASSFADVVAAMGRHRIVLLGERHDARDDHRWQLHVVAALIADTRPVVLGFEAFPRTVQPVLDAWSVGELDVPELLERSQWRRNWPMEPNLYLPLLHLARMHRLPVVALNVPRETTRAVRRRGWDALTESKRHGLSTPAAAPAAYRERLETVYAAHRCGPAPEGAFDRFVEAQLVWDHAMAAALWRAADAHPDAVVVGIVGRGHAARPGGIDNQLAGLGAPLPFVLLTSDPTCEPGAAGGDVLFGVAPLASEQPPPAPSPCDAPDAPGAGSPP